MKKITLCVFTAVFLMITASTAAVSQSKAIFRATLGDKTTTPKMATDAVILKFSGQLTETLQFYKVLAPMKSEIRGDTQLINDLYYEPRLLATAVYVYSDTVELVFARGVPPPDQLANILNRVIQVVHRNTAPTARLEIDGYNPLIGADLGRPKTFFIPPPINASSKVTWRKSSNFARGVIPVEYITDYRLQAKNKPKKP